METEKSLLAQSIDKIKFVCHLSGINITNTKINTLKLKLNLMLLFNFQCLNFDLIGAIYAFVIRIKDGKNFVESTYIAPCMTFSFLANIKAFTVTLNGSKLQKLITSLKEMEIKDNKRQKNPKKDEVIEEQIGFFNRLIKVLNITYIVLITGFSVNPLLLMLYKYYKTDKLEPVLPFLISYPFDAYDIRNWPAVYLHQVWSNVVVIVDVCSSDYIFYTCCNFITLQFRFLQIEIQELVTEKNRSDNFRSKFREIVMWHQELIRCSQDLEEIYSKCTLFNFVTSSILICLTGFDVLVISDKFMVISFASFLFTNLLQIFFLCYFGDLLMRSSMGVGDAAYTCQWYTKHPSIGRSLLVMMIRSCKPCKLTAYGFADVNLTAFMRILSNAWSYFALLKTIYG